MGRTSNAHGLLLAASLSFAWGCTDDKKAREVEEPEVDASAPDAEMDDAGPDAGPGCTPMADHLEIINAATDTEKVDKQPVLRLLNADGTLPDLP
jgi:hypothetical protein